MILVERIAQAISKCVFCHGSGTVPEEHGQGLTEYLGCRDCQATGVGIRFGTARLFAEVVLADLGLQEAGNHIPDERPGLLDAPWMNEPDPEDTNA